MVRFELDENLATISSEGNLTSIVFHLITWAESTGRLEELIAAAHRTNPGNPMLSRFVETFGPHSPDTEGDVSGVSGQGTLRTTSIEPDDQRGSSRERTVEQIIAEASQAGSTTLSLSNRGLLEIPDELYTCTELTDLDLSGNQLASLSEKIGDLKRLEVLNLAGNRLQQLPDNIALLRRLRSLDLSKNEFAEFPKVMGDLRALVSLDLSANRLMQTLSVLFTLPLLQVLRLNSNNIVQLSIEIGDSTALTSLDLSLNRLSRIPGAIGRLAHLRELNLSENRMSALPPQFGQLSLQELNLSKNEFTEFPEPVLHLRSLSYLNLSDNYLKELPYTIRQLSNLSEINLERNPFSQAVEILASSRDPIRLFAFLEEQGKSKKKPLNEAKLILVGEPSVGKTSLVKLLTGGDFILGENTTKEISIQPWSVEHKGHRIQVNVWDFGGQDIMHATHQFFLTKRSVYVLVLDSRIGERASRLEYWLKLIRSYGGDSPVVVVCNKSDQNQMALNWSHLKEKYGIAEYVRECSYLTGVGIPELRDVLTKIIAELPHVSDPVSESWLRVKNVIASREADIISIQEYRAIAAANGIEGDTAQDNLLRYLNDLGIMLWFGDDPRLTETSVINPKWLTHAIYTIINSNELFQQRGKIKIQQLYQILDKEIYKNKIPFIVDVMKRFALCFSLDSQQGEAILVPGLLPLDEPYIDMPSNCLRFEFRYEALPSSIISRLIVRMNAFSPKNTFWRTGIFLARDNVQAVVKSEEEEAHITIAVAGASDERRMFLSTLRTEMRIIHSTVSEIAATEWVPIPGNPAAVSYEQLLANKREGIEKFVPANMTTPVVVRDLLEGVDPPEKGSGIKANEPRKFTDAIPSKLRLLINEEIELLLRMPASTTFEGRSSYLFGVPGASRLNRSTINAQGDLSLLFEQLWNREMVFDSNHPLWIIAENALPYTGGAETSWGQQILDLRSQMEQIYKEL